MKPGEIDMKRSREDGTLLAFASVDLSTVEEVLDDLAGCFVRLARYQMSLSILTILLEREGDKDTFRVECLETKRMALPVEWEDSCLKIIDVSTEPQFRRFQLLDSSAGADIICSEVLVSRGGEA